MESKEVIKGKIDIINFWYRHGRMTKEERIKTIYFSGLKEGY
ncbi:MAG: hypothetical protein WC877_01880 [Dehalococcoidales bacterium]